MSEWDVETLQKIAKEAAEKISEGKRVVIQITTLDGKFMLGCAVGEGMKKYKTFMQDRRYSDSLDDILEMIKEC